MTRLANIVRLLPVLTLLCVAWDAEAQSFRVQCPTTTLTHPNAAANNFVAAPYSGPTQYVSTTPLAPDKGYLEPVPATVNGSIKCQQVAGGDGYATMADGTQKYLFAFGPASGLANVAAGKPGTVTPDIFNSYFGINANFPYSATGPVLSPGDPATTDVPTPATYLASTTGTVGFNPSFTFNGAVGLSQTVNQLYSIYDISEGVYPACTVPVLSPGVTTYPVPPGAPLTINTSGRLANNPASTATGIDPNVVTVVVNEPANFQVGDKVVIAGTGNPNYDGTHTVSAVGLYNWCYTQSSVNASQFPNGSQYAFTFNLPPTVLNQAQVTMSSTATASSPPGNDNGHIDPRQLMDVAVMNGNEPAPLIAIDEDDELFLTLSNVGMIMRPDLFEQHTIHFHGYPNASALYDGVPDASVAISIAASFSYYYLAPDAGTYFWHCHITPPEHLQMGMVGQLYVRPRQNRVPSSTKLYDALVAQQSELRTACNPATDFTCSNSLPAVKTAATGGYDPTKPDPQTKKFVYNDGDGSTAYDVEYPIQLMGFDPNFHFVGMTFNGEGFADMKDKYFLLNGRSYPDTVRPGPLATPSSDGVYHFSQPMPAIINIPLGGRALLRLSQLSVAEYMTLQSIGIPMTVVGWNAKLLRDQSGNNLSYLTNSITIGGGESADVILDASNKSLYQAGQVFYVYSRNLDQLSNDAENFGGLMTEVHICNSVSGGSTFGNTCL